MALRQAEAGTPVEEICRKPEVSAATFFRWKNRFDESAYHSIGLSTSKKYKTPWTDGPSRTTLRGRTAP